MYKDVEKQRAYWREYARTHPNPTRRAYYDARRRCTDPTRNNYARYGGRGIEFRFTSYGQFVEALRTPDNPTGLRPSPVYSLDRINTNGHYETGNVRWALADVQAANRRAESKPRVTRGVPWTPEQRKARVLTRMNSIPSTLHP